MHYLVYDYGTKQEIIWSKDKHEIANKKITDIQGKETTLLAYTGWLICPKEYVLSLKKSNYALPIRL